MTSRADCGGGPAWPIRVSRVAARTAAIETVIAIRLMASFQKGTSHAGAWTLNKVGEPTRSALDRVPNEQPPFHGMAAFCGARCQTTTRGYRGSWSGITQSVGGPLQRYVDRRLTILWTWTTLLKLHAEIDDEPELFAG